jgi:hypothetical protein
MNNALTFEEKQYLLVLTCKRYAELETKLEQVSTQEEEADIKENQKMIRLILKKLT